MGAGSWRSGLLSRARRSQRLPRRSGSAFAARGSGSGDTKRPAKPASLIALRRRGGSRTARRGSREAVIMRLRQLRMTAAEIAETLAMPLSTVSVVLRATVPAGSAGSGSSSRCATSGRGQASSSTSTSKSSAGSKAAPANAWRDGRSAPTTPSTPTPRPRPQHGWLGVRPRRRRRLLTPRLRRGTARRESLDRRRLPRPRNRLLRSATASPSNGVLTDNGSCYRGTRPRRRLPHARHPPPPHTPLPAADKRQSRTLHPHPDQRLGLRRHLPLKQRTHPRP